MTYVMILKGKLSIVPSGLAIELTITNRADFIRLEQFADFTNNDYIIQLQIDTSGFLYRGIPIKEVIILP